MMHRSSSSFLPVLLLVGVVLVGGLALVGLRSRGAHAPVGTEVSLPLASRVGTPDVQTAAFKIYTDADGIYAVRRTDLSAQVEDLSQYRLFAGGQLQPSWVTGQGSAQVLHFYAQASQSLYSSENVFFLLPQDSSAEISELEKPTVTISPTITTGVDDPRTGLDASTLEAGTYFARLHLEENKLYNPQAADGSHWLWSSLPAPQQQSFDFQLDNLASGPGFIQLEVYATTEAPANPDHTLRLQLNGQLVGEQTWDGAGAHLLNANLPAGILHSGKNTLVLEAPGTPQVIVDITSLDWFEISYPRKPIPQDDRLDFFSPGGTLDLTAFSGPVDVYAVGGLAGVDLLESGVTGMLKTTSDQRYWLVGPQGYRSPQRVEAVQLVPNLRAAGAGADYIAIGPPDLLAPLQPLLDRRKTQGWHIQSVDVQKIYDQFNGGRPEPQAIRLFLQYAVKHWQPAPRAVLLVGDATYDPRMYLSTPEANRLPVFLVDTIYGGQTASDVVFTQLDGDDRPDLAVGRIPAQTAQQVSTWVTKILEYEQEGVQPGGYSSTDDNHILAVADGQDPTFKKDAQNFLDLFPTTFKVDLFAPQAGVENANQQVIQRINQGDALVAYFGHGSVNMWGKDRLFTTEDVKGLTNAARLPVVLNMTCLNGLFTHPKVESLAEALLWQPQGGAVAVLAPTSLTLPTDQSFLSKPLVESLISDPQISLGEALLQARRQIPKNNPGARDVMQTFLLFGDPAMHVELP